MRGIGDATSQLVFLIVVLNVELRRTTGFCHSGCQVETFFHRLVERIQLHLPAMDAVAGLL